MLALLAQGTRLVTLTGPGGVGKTRLALRIGEAAAAQYADGVVFVSLATVATPGLVLPSIARALGLQDWGEQPAGEVVARTLRDSRLLLVIDNFEQVRSAAADLAAILGRCPGVDAIVTSRVLLRVTGERRFPVAPLALPVAPRARRDGPGHGVATAIAAAPAVQLFVARAQAADPGFALHDRNASAIADICRRLDGLPLAIELAAARTFLLEPAELLARLRPALPLLSGGPDDAPDRLRTMSDAIAWSYDLLTADEQRLLRRLAVFAGGFSLERRRSRSLALTRGCAGRECGLPTSHRQLGATRNPPPLPLLPPWWNKSLLQRMSADGESRFTMLETIREFALDRLVASDEAEAIATCSRGVVRRPGRGGTPIGTALPSRRAGPPRSGASQPAGGAVLVAGAG